MDHRIIYVGAQTIFGTMFLVLFFLRRIDHRRSGLDHLDALYLLMLATTILDSIWMMIDGVPKYRVGHVVLQVVYLSAMSFTGYCWFLHTMDLFPAKSLRIRRYRRLFLVPVLIVNVLILCSIRTGWIFIVDQNGLYTRGDWHIYTILLNYIYMLLGSYVALRCRQEALLAADRRRFSVAAFFPLPVLFLSAAQLFLPPGLPAMQGGVLVALLMVYGTSQNVLITRDHLTGLPNRFTFEHDLTERLHRHRTRGARHLYLLAGDLDKFKEINDTYGHPAGDRALRQTADVLRTVFHPYGAAVFRTGGDEFMMIAERREPLVLDEVRDALDQGLANAKSPDPIRLRMSLGMVECGAHTDFQTALEEVDRALYDAKTQANHQGSSGV